MLEAANTKVTEAEAALVQLRTEQAEAQAVVQTATEALTRLHLELAPTPAPPPEPAMALVQVLQHVQHALLAAAKDSASLSPETKTALAALEAFVPQQQQPPT